ncbi:unnamed protein product [Mycena citricolor]|uniref:Mitochondrial splicing suppressor 51-like C-terminal domain-containing protein n=1 Tax=Mycena citricolor TaxID=2018698 RepID=A0AAD2HEW2_9AGAR|nr:unnamed protein product [Mycena citricolor]
MLAAASNTHWRPTGTHKALCRALKKLEKENPQIPPIEIPRTEPILDPGQLASLCDSHDQNMREVIERTMGRALEMHERSIIEWEPRCLVCPRTDQLLRFETGLSGSAAPRLIPCPQCNLSFCCSDAHWAAAQQLHHTSSQCELNHQVRADVVFEVAMASSGRDPRGAFIWAPTRLSTHFVSLLGSTGPNRTVDPGNVCSFGDAHAILHALEKLNERSLAWTRKDLLTVHVMGATSNEIAADRTFEEILHRLPDVQTLKLVFCGPDMADSGRVSTAKTCT